MTKERTQLTAVQRQELEHPVPDYLGRGRLGYFRFALICFLGAILLGAAAGVLIWFLNH